MNQTSKFIVRTSAFLVIVSSLSRILGLVREAAIAGYFGAGSETDAFFIAFRIPDLLFNSLLGFLVATSFIPVFSEYMVKEDEAEKWEFVNNTVNFMSIVLVLFVVVVEVFAPCLIFLIAPGIQDNEFTLAVTLTRTMVPIVLLGGWAGLGKSLLNSLNHFTAPAFIPVVYNVAIISAVVFFGSLHGVVALAIGVVIAAFLQVAIQVPALIKNGVRYAPVLDLRNDGIRKVARILAPVILALCIGQMIPFVEIYLASKISPGAISYLSYAGRIFLMPEQLFTFALSTVLFPSMAMDVSRGRITGMVEKLSVGLRLTVFSALPISLIFLTFGSNIIQILLGRGAFDLPAIEGTSKALAAYSVGLFAVCVRHLVIFAFFAMKDSITLLKVSAVMAPLNIFLDLLLIRYFSYWGLALGASVTAFFHAGALVLILRRRIGRIDGSRIMVSFLKTVFCSMIMLLATLPLKGSHNLFQSFSPFGQQTASLTLVACIALGSFFFAARLVRSQEANLLFKLAFKRNRD